MLLLMAYGILWCLLGIKVKNGIPQVDTVTAGESVSSFHRIRVQKVNKHVRSLISNFFGTLMIYSLFIALSVIHKVEVYEIHAYLF